MDRWSPPNDKKVLTADKDGDDDTVTLNNISTERGWDADPGEKGRKEMAKQK